jgi:hypothetical protein
MKNKITILSAILSLVVVIVAGVGFFYRDGGSPRYVESVHGEIIQLFGDGIYANMPTFFAHTAIGTNLVFLFVAALFLLVTLKRDTGQKMQLVHGGLLTSILFYSMKAFETVLNRLFLLYIVLFAVAFWTFICTMIELSKTIQPSTKDSSYKKTAIFTMITGLTLLVWLLDFIPFTITGEPPGVISIFTSSPTVIIHIAVVLPTCILGGSMLLQKKKWGFILPPLMNIFLVSISLTAISRTAFMLNADVYVPMANLVVYLGVFPIFGLIALVVVIRFLLRCWPNSLVRK